MKKALPAAIALGLGPGPLPVVHTHGVAPNAAAHPRDTDLRQTLCGCYVYPPTSASETPTCPTCARALPSAEV